MSRIQDLVEQCADSILQGIDYDIYKEDLEEKELLTGIEQELKTLLSDICDAATLDDILDFIGN